MIQTIRGLLSKIRMFYYFKTVAISMLLLVGNQTLSQDIDNIDIHYSWKQLFEITISNNSLDTAYLFDSYLSQDLSRNKYLRRYNISLSSCKVSYLPFSEYLHIVREGAVLTQEMILEPFKVKWSFREIPPNAKEAITLSRATFSRMDDLVLLDFDPKRPVQKSNLEFIDVNSAKDLDFVNLELAFFDKHDVDMLKLTPNRSLDLMEFNKSRVRYSAKSIQIKKL